MSSHLKQAVRSEDDPDFDPFASPSKKRAVSRPDKSVSPGCAFAGGTATDSSRRLPATPRSRHKSSSSPSSSGRRQQQPSSPSSSAKLALKFDGKVYRTLDKSTSGLSYSPQADFLGAPDESVADLESEKADKRRKAVERDLLASRMMTASSSRIDLDSSDDDDTGRNALLTPTKTRHRSEKKKTKRHGQPQQANKRLPEPLAQLLALHMSLESSLLLHLANEGSNVASQTQDTNEDGDAVISIPNLIDLLDLSKKMESGGKRLAEADLARLLWVWSGCTATEDISHREPATSDARKGMGFIVSRTRVNSPTNGIVSTYGIGIELVVKTNPQLPKFELVHGSPTATPPKSPPKSPGSGRSAGTRGREGMSVVALWSAGNETRRNEFEARLHRWADEQLKRQRRLQQDSALLFDGVLPAIPRAQLPSLTPAVPTVPSTPSPSPSKKRQQREDLFGPAIPIASSSHKGNVDMFIKTDRSASASGGARAAKDRRQAMLDRIQAKAESKQAAYLESISHLVEGSPTKKSLKSSLSTSDLSGAKGATTSGGQSWRVEQMERYKRNAMLSRLPGIAEAVWMLLDKSGSGRSMLMEDVALSVSKSAKVVLSEDEARESVQALAELCPAFVQVKTVDKDLWVSLRTGASLAEARTAVKAELARSSF